MRREKQEIEHDRMSVKNERDRLSLVGAVGPYGFNPLGGASSATGGPGPSTYGGGFNDSASISGSVVEYAMNGGIDDVLDVCFVRS